MMKLIRASLPPIVFSLIKKIFISMKNKGQNCLFDGDEKAFKNAFSSARVYAEYGCGASTVWVAKNTNCLILSVDSSRECVNKVNNQCGQNKNLKLHYADIGSIGEWGRPLGYSMCENFMDYTDWIWSSNCKPDVILIDRPIQSMLFPNFFDQRQGGCINFL
jgi:hypothetical protein